ncbi:MAG: preprotein translocase subunit SecE [Planctomycetota bacterium]
MAELIAGMFNTSRYKRSQGRIARQLTFLALAVTVAIGAWRLSSAADNDVQRYVVPVAVLAVGAWAAYRIVNYPPFADFLISVEVEMNKVSWPSRSELYRASMVVIVVIFLLVAILFGFDLFLDWFLDLVFGL